MDLEKLSPLKISLDNLTIPYLKKHSLDFNDCQIEAFKNKYDITKLVKQRARYIDELLTRLWDFVGLNESYDLSLVAVGGYGRGELHPKSDIDLLILSESGFSEQSEQKISQLITLLWDLKLDVGQSVRTLDDCYEQGKDDITIATSMLEARFLVGNQQTFEKLQTLLADETFWPSDRFFIAKKEEQRARHKTCHGDGYSLEPDIKNGPGGLRDLQTVAWISKLHFNAHSLLELTTFNYITPGEYRELVDCQTFLWTIRFALHTATKRPDNRLLFDFQSEVAALLGYKGAANEAIEQMMKDFTKQFIALKSSTICCSNILMKRLLET